MAEYHRPPDDYSPPTWCEQCGEVIMYRPVIGGYIWSHVVLADHDVVMRSEGWWDVATGMVRYGNGRAGLVAPLETGQGVGHD
jgi:hypothetical protein